MSVTVTTACDTAHPSRVRILALSPISRNSLKKVSTGPWRARTSARSARPRHGPMVDYSPGWASSMSWPSTPAPVTVRAVATGG